MSRLFPLILLVACVAASGCSRAVDILPAGLARLAPYGSNETVGAETVYREVAVQRSDGRTVVLSQAFDAMVVPVVGPSRVFLRPVTARVRDGVLVISGSNRPECRIPTSDVASIVVYR